MQATIFLRHIAVDDLRESDVAAVRLYVECLRLDTGRVHGLPFQVVARDFGIRRRLSFFSYRSDGRRAVDGFLGAGDIGQSASRIELGKLARDGRAARTCDSHISTYCCWAHLNIAAVRGA